MKQLHAFAASDRIAEHYASAGLVVMVAAPLVPKVYVFVCDTGEFCALTIQCDGGNLPCCETAKTEQCAMSCT